MDGVLKSWAVTRGPSLVPGEKRLAVHVEDHPLDYRNFEGVIPEGQYGAGEVIVWDKGVWIPEGDPHKGYAKGHLDFELRGEKLGGRWHLVRMARKPREKHDNWLLIKSEDEFARAPEDEDILDEMPRSVDTGRTIGDVAEGKPARRSKKSRRAKAGRGAPVNQDKRRRANASACGRHRPVASQGREEGAAAEFRCADAGQFRRRAARARNGFTKSNSTAIACRRASRRDAYGCSRAAVSIGRRNLAMRWSALRALPVGTALIDGEMVVETSSGASDFSGAAGRSERRADRSLRLLGLRSSLPRWLRSARRDLAGTQAVARSTLGR